MNQLVRKQSTRSNFSCLSLVIMSLQYCGTTWCGCLSGALMSQLLQTLVDNHFRGYMQLCMTSIILRLVRNLTSNTRQVLCGESRLLAAERRYGVAEYIAYRAAGSQEKFQCELTIKYNIISFHVTTALQDLTLANSFLCRCT